MDVLRTTYNYGFRDLVLFKFRSYNAYGWSLDYSDANSAGATIRTEPEPVGTIYVNDFETTTEQISVYWSALTDGSKIGDSTVLSYNLEWDAGTSQVTWTSLIGDPIDSLSTAYIVQTGVQDGQHYNFRVRARNIYGFGQFSTVYQFKAAQEPQ
jgi:hypothetical protein